MKLGARQSFPKKLGAIQQWPCGQRQRKLLQCKQLKGLGASSFWRQTHRHMGSSQDELQNGGCVFRFPSNQSIPSKQDAPTCASGDSCPCSPGPFKSHWSCGRIAALPGSRPNGGPMGCHNFSPTKTNPKSFPDFPDIARNFRREFGNGRTYSQAPDLCLVQESIDSQAFSSSILQGFLRWLLLPNLATRTFAFAAA